MNRSIFLLGAAGCALARTAHSDEQSDAAHRERWNRAVQNAANDSAPFESATATTNFKIRARGNNTDGTMVVHFEQGKYHVKIDYQRPTPDFAYAVWDGKTAVLAEFCPRIHPTGCSASLSDKLRLQFLRLPWNDPIQPWSYHLSAKSLQQDQNAPDIKFEQLDPNRLLVIIPHGEARNEYELDSRFDDRIVAIRTYAPGKSEPVFIQWLSWKRLGNRWIGDKMSQAFVGHSKAAIHVKEFQADAVIDDHLFSALESIPVPDGTRFSDRRPNPKSKFLWKVGSELTPVQPEPRADPR